MLNRIFGRKKQDAPQQSAQKDAQKKAFEDMGVLAKKSLELLRLRREGKESSPDANRIRREMREIRARNRRLSVAK